MATKNTSEKPAVQLQADGLAQLQRDLKNASKDALRLFRAAMRKGGDIVAAEARNRISGTSSRIADSIKVSATNKGVAVRAGGGDAPHAAALENLGKTGTFRHPVFGNREVWVEQQAHPYLGPAAEGKMDDVADAFLDAVNALLGEAGFS